MGTTARSNSSPKTQRVSSIRFRLDPLARLCALAGMVLIFRPAVVAQVTLSGHVTDENNAPVAGVLLTLLPENGATPVPAAAPGSVALRAVSDAAGNFVIRPPVAGEYRITAEHENYFSIRDSAVAVRQGTNDITLTLNTLREVFESVNVTSAAPQIDMTRASSETTLTSTEMVLQPYPNTYNFRNAVRLLPGVIQDTSGGIHINGGTEEQALYTLDGFNVNDPITGRLETHVSVESVRSFDLSSGLLPAEVGKGSAGTLSIKTATGNDRFRYSATNFVPGIANRKGWIVNAWTPRLNLSGPVRKGRAWFSDSFDAQYGVTVVPELPRSQDHSPRLSFSNLLHSQVNLTPSNILYTGFLLNTTDANHVGLSALSPLETTVDRVERQYFFHLKDQIYFHNGFLLEAGYAINRTAFRDTPRGRALYQMTPNGNQGNFFADTRQRARRDQWLMNLYLPSWTAWGSHEVKLGTDFDRLHYWQDISRTSYENLRADGTPLSLVTFGGSGWLSRNNLEASSYVQDAWRIRPSFLLDGGIRQDWDALLGNTVVSPRAGFAWSPPRLGQTKISAGYGVIYDATSLQWFARTQDQYSLTTTFAPDGTVSRGPAITAFIPTSRQLKTPRYENWTLGVERRLPWNLFASFNYLRKRGQDGLTFSNTAGAVSSQRLNEITAASTPLIDAVYQMENFRSDSYDSYEMTVRQTFQNQYEWSASYVRSHALSNAVLDVNVDQPLQAALNQGPMPWDSPNRFLTWGNLPAPRKNWSLVYLVDWRNGFPFSVHDAAGTIIGSVNSHRFPNYFSLNLHLERRFHVFGYWWAFRGGFNNLTGHQNPDTVNTNINSTHYLHF